MKLRSIITECLIYATYYAPRGRDRLLILGQRLAERYVAADDYLIGVIGGERSGKSSLIRGMFPGLELTNDDEGINRRPLPLLRDEQAGRFGSHTYHLDMRFEMAFSQAYEIAQAVRHALDADRRVIVEHFDMLYPHLKMNAQVLVAIGEEVVIARPNLFGPLPEQLAGPAVESLPYRFMAHTAEDITSFVLERDFGFGPQMGHSDVRRGFVIEMDERPAFDPAQVEARAKDIIGRHLDVCYHDESHLRIGDHVCHCTGPRMHVTNTSEIECFRLLKRVAVDHHTGKYLLVGLVGEGHPAPLDSIAWVDEDGAPTEQE